MYRVEKSVGGQIAGWLSDRWHAEGNLGNHGVDLEEEKRMKRARLLSAIALALAIMLIPVFGASAQDATPEGTPAAECIAPELPPGTPTDPVASPVGDDGMEMEAETAAPVREGPASRSIAADGEAALQNLVNCLNAADWTGVAALMTAEHGDVGSLAPIIPTMSSRMFEGEPPSTMEIIDVRNPVIDTNNRVGLSVVSTGLFTSPGIQIAEKWYFVRDGDCTEARRDRHNHNAGGSLSRCDGRQCPDGGLRVRVGHELRCRQVQ